MKYSLVIPCYNEAKNIPLLLQRCNTLKNIDGLEVILVDNGSTDESPEVLDALLPDYPHCRSVRVDVNDGYGNGIIAGLDCAKGKILGWTHADMQTDPQDFLKALKKIDDVSEPPFIKGKRYGRPLSDTFFTVGMSFFESILLRVPLWDINAQPTVFGRHFYESLEEKPKDFSLDLFFYYMAKKQGIPVLRFPVVFSARAFGHSHWNINWRAKWKFIKRTIDFSLNLRGRL